MRFLKSELGESLPGGEGECGQSLEVVMLREVCRLRLGGWAVRGLSSQGKDRTLPFLPPIASAAPSHLSRHPPPSPHLSQSKDWKIDASVYKAHNVASKTRHSAEQLGASNGILFMSFSSRRWSHYHPGWCSVTLHSPSNVPMSR